MSATELAENEEAAEAASPPRKASVEESSIAPAVNKHLVSPSFSSSDAAVAVAPLSTSASLSLSKLQLENELLRSEIQSLNEEMQGWPMKDLSNCSCPAVITTMRTIDE